MSMLHLLDANRLELGAVASRNLRLALACRDDGRNHLRSIFADEDEPCHLRSILAESKDPAEPAHLRSVFLG
jgi:hypothetical protein